MIRTLAIIVVSQFFCTSLWFAGNAIIPDIINNQHLDPGFLAHLTSAVQFGFIAGTLVFAIFTIADRFSPSKVFFISALVAALFNLALSVDYIPSIGVLGFRFLTGFFLAGIYPVGMKIASDHFQKGLGKSLGLLVGALVLGTAFPHLLKSMSATLPWEYVVYSTSALSVLGGLTMILFVSDGPYRKAGQPLKFTAFMAGFQNKYFRSAALGYFGHMWELYAFWAFVPLMLSAYKIQYPFSTLNVSLYSALIIGSGGIACAGSGLLSQSFNTKNIATLALFLSGMCGLLSPLFLYHPTEWILLAFLFFWGLVVIADSPLFSTLVAWHAPDELRGASLTIVNSMGFAITIVSIQFIGAFASYISPQYLYLLLSIGPVFGLIVLIRGENAPQNQSRS